MEDFILNGQATGDVASALLASGFDPCALRPYIGNDGRTYITRNGVAVPQTNATATLRKDDWKTLDDAIVKAAKPRLKLVGDLRGAGLQHVIPNGMGKTVLETETMSDINDADISMDGLRTGQADRPLFELTNLPLPITHKDFHFSARQIAASRNGGSPLDTTTAELAARKVAEGVEKLSIGRSGTYAYGGGTIYGLTNYTSALTKTITSPAVGGWTAATILSEVLAMRQQSIAAYHYGPWMIYNAPNWDQYLDNDYNTTSGVTVRERLQKIAGITDIRTLDYLTNYDFILVQMTSDVIRVVVGMEITTVQWDTQGGLQKNFKVMCILVPQLRCDQNSRTGIVYGSV